MQTRFLQLSSFRKAVRDQVVGIMWTSGSTWSNSKKKNESRKRRFKGKRIEHQPDCLYVYAKTLYKKVKKKSEVWWNTPALDLCRWHDTSTFLRNCKKKLLKIPKVSRTYWCIVSRIIRSRHNRYEDWVSAHLLCFSTRRFCFESALSSSSTATLSFSFCSFSVRTVSSSWAISSSFCLLPSSLSIFKRSSWDHNTKFSQEVRIWLDCHD